MRGFAEAEFRGRLHKAQTLMAEAGIGAILLTTEPEFRYFSGFLTRFWESPSRPWFLILPAQGDPVAVIPSIGTALMQSTWVQDIRTWPAPDPRDEGVSLLVEALRELQREPQRVQQRKQPQERPHGLGQVVDGLRPHRVLAEHLHPDHLQFKQRQVVAPQQKVVQATRRAVVRLRDPRIDARRQVQVRAQAPVRP